MDEPRELEVGDMVMLNSGSPPLEIIAITDDGQATVTWQLPITVIISPVGLPAVTWNFETQTADFPVECLTLLNEI